jgi:hypothetical protein
MSSFLFSRATRFVFLGSMAVGALLIAWTSSSTKR